MKTRRNIMVVVDGQFGSTGKGLLAGYLAKKHPIDTIVTAWAANAGHTFIDDDGTKYVHTMLANGIVGPHVKQVLLGAGSVIDPVNLEAEYIAAYGKMENIKLYIHPQAAVISQAHRDVEGTTMTAIGSTKKGVGEAMIQRIKRDPHDQNTAAMSDHPFIRAHVVPLRKFNDQLDQAQNILIEGAQGYSLSMYHGFYPYTTSRDVSVYQTLADCCIPHNFGDIEVYGSFRTYPIRVANRFNEKGEMVGWSGPHYPDQDETSFQRIGQDIELTTVTKLPRRIFTFSMIQYVEAIRQCGIDKVFLNFANYLNDDEEPIGGFIERLEAFAPHVPVVLLGWGPTVNDIQEV